jgi:hypothetical protein
MRKVSVRNNLVHDGIFVHKCIAANRMIRMCDVEFNTIEYRLIVEIQKAIERNHRQWKDAERRTFLGQSRARNETEDKLTAVRKNVFEKRADITLLQAKLIQRKEEYEKAIVDKAERLTNLETRLNDLIDQSGVVTDENRANTAVASGALEQSAGEVSGLSNRLGRETETASKEARALVVLEQRVGNAKSSFIAELGDLNVALQHAVARYEDYKRNLIAAWQNAKLLAQAREAEELEAKQAAPATAGKRKAARSKRRGKK